MKLTFEDATPAAERLRPAATAAELTWFRKKRRMALARTTITTGGLCVICLVGALLRSPHRQEDVPILFALGIAAMWQVTRAVLVMRSANLVKDIRAKRSAMYDDQRKRIFLAALDDDVPAT